MTARLRYAVETVEGDSVEPTPADADTDAQAEGAAVAAATGVSCHSRVIDRRLHGDVESETAR